MNKFVFVTGGVCSGLGKAVATAAIGSLIESAGVPVAMIKCDPYINLDAANMNPSQNGEVYVTEDGGETDLDLGTYSRFTSFSPLREHSITMGQIYNDVIKNERVGRYNGRTVQVIPHITDEIKRRIFCAASRSSAEIVLVEIGGTVGDIESIPFLEAVRQLIRELGRPNAISVHLTLVPVLAWGEMKTKPTQHAVKKMQEIGIQPDILLCRAETPLDSSLRNKIALFCNVETGAVFTTGDVEKTIYELPVAFHKQGLDSKILSKLGYTDKKCNVRAWASFLGKLNNPAKKVRIGLVSKKNFQEDCYKSVGAALLHAAVTGHNAELDMVKLDAESLEKERNLGHIFSGLQGVIVPDVPGQRGFLGLLAAVRFARERGIPFLGINFGMQLMAIEAARNLLKWEDADSTEFVHSTAYPVISLPEEQAGLAAAGSDKLGAGEVVLERDSALRGIYGADKITERHRSKYAFDRKYTAGMISAGLIPAGTALDGQIEAFEWASHPWGIGVQYHPEFASRPSKPHPLFSAFIGAALRHE
ncbi:MAG: CTP synthase [Spirochaetaceae bacterium]|jgi:CTP synthase|nr:CTP synthase [Spirochaetaceae bacterium]